MTTDELAEILKKHPGLLVVVDGHEYGTTEEIRVGVNKIKLGENAGVGDWAGEHGDEYDPNGTEVFRISRLLE